VIRGGSFNNNASKLLSSNRNNNTPDNRNNNIGLRCAKTVTSLHPPGRPESRRSTDDASVAAHSPPRRSG